MIIIPARLASTRFPNKIIADVNGLPMVIRTAKRVSDIDEAVVACDDESVVDLCSKYKIKSVLTSKSHQSGTDRINEAVKILGAKADEIIINVQADEPYIEPEIINILVSTVKSCSNDWKMASLCKKISIDAAKDSNLVKVIMDQESNAIYFSRNPIPFDRDGGFDNYFGHLGLYGFSASSLDEFCTLPYSALEHTEKLEQLRAIESRKAIKMAIVETKSFGIDTAEDLKKAIEVFG